MKLRFAAVAALLFTPLAALAAETPPAPATPPAANAAAAPQDRAARWAACSSEIQKFCADIESGKGKKRACLEAHTAELSDGCKARMAEHHGKPN